MQFDVFPAVQKFLYPPAGSIDIVAVAERTEIEEAGFDRVETVCGRGCDGGEIRADIDGFGGDVSFY